MLIGLWNGVTRMPLLLIIIRPPMTPRLGVMIDESLSWAPHIDFLGKRTQQRVSFLCRVKSFGTSSQMMFLYFTSVIRSIALYCYAILPGWATSQWKNKTKNKLYNQTKVCSKITGLPVAQAFQEAHDNSTLRAQSTHRYAYASARLRNVTPLCVDA